MNWSGTPSIAADTFVLHGTGMPDNVAVYFQGMSQVNSGAGVGFGDGLRCAGGSVVRLGTKLNLGGASQHPEARDPPISIQSANAFGSVRTYQVWYRDPASFCTAGTFNLTNGLEALWIP